MLCCTPPSAQLLAAPAGTDTGTGGFLQLIESNCFADNQEDSQLTSLREKSSGNGIVLFQTCMQNGVQLDIQEGQTAPEQFLICHFVIVRNMLQSFINERKVRSLVIWG